MKRSMMMIVPLVAGVLAGTPPTVSAQEAEVYNFRVVTAGAATQIVIETTGRVRFRDTFEPLPPRLTIELDGATAGLPLKEYDDIYRGGVRYAVASTPAPGMVRLDFALTGVTSYAAYQDGNDVYISFENPGQSFPSFVANPVGEAGLAAHTLANAADAVPGGQVAHGRRNEPGLPGVQGDPITISFQNADIKSVIRAFGAFSGRSIVAGSGISDMLITADVRNQPWDEALVTLMRANGLAVRIENDMIRVDSVQNLREAELFLDLVTEILHLNFITAEDIVPVVVPLVSERGSVQADAKTNSLVVTDVPDRVDQITGIIEELDVQTPQVTIKAKIVFVNKVDLREIGVKWRAENLRNPTTDTHVLGNTEGTIADPFLELSIGSLASGLNVGGLLQALEQRELADIQAEPQTTVLNNLPAEIFVGERTPIRVLDVGADSPTATASVELIETGIILNVTPHITSNGKVLMRLRAERSGVAVADPEIGVTFNTQRASTVILVDDGETAVIGGLTVVDVSSSRSGIPILMDIPVLGALFRTERKRREKRDLLIFVTPYIVPVDRAVEHSVASACVEDQAWYRGGQAILHNGQDWLDYGAPGPIPPSDLIAVGNYRGVALFTTVDKAATEIYLPLCARGVYQAYRPVAGLRTAG